LIFCQLFPFFMIPSSTCLNNLVVSHPVGLFPLNFNSDPLLSILVLSVLPTMT
jgi:hypothetical protein